MTIAVDQKSTDVIVMGEHWPVIEALMGGTPAMRKAGERLLPKWPNEEDDSYDARLGTATLFPAYRRTVSVMAGKPFAKPLTLAKETPAQIVEWADDIDREGRNLHTFAAETFNEALAYGVCGILVESPKKPEPINGRVLTREEQIKAGMRPYFVRIKHEQILGWKLAIGNGGARLTQLRILESGVEDDGEFGQKCVERVRVLEPGSYRVFEKKKTAAGEAWSVADQGKTDLDFIPYVPVYGFRKAFMIGEAPLVDLAYLNVKHYQSQSDQDTILHVARVPILFFKGMDDENKIAVGAGYALKTSAPDADGKYIEHTGQAISAGRQSLLDLEEQMIQTGAELLVKKPGHRSATESANDAEANKCDLQRITEGFEDSLDLALFYMAKYSSLDSGGHASLYKDFAAATLSEASATIINDMQSRGLLSKETTIKEQQRRGVLSSDIDPKKEIAAAEQEGPAPGTLTDGDDQ